MTIKELNELQNIILGCTDNKRSDQEKLYKMFYSKMLKLAIRYSKDQSSAEDIVSISFLKAFQNISKYTFDGSFEGWLRQITIRTALDSIKKNEKYNKDTIFVEKEDFTSLNSISDPFYYKFLIKIIEALPKIYKDVFSLNTEYGYSHKKIASVLGISEAMSKWYLNKSRNILKEKIKCYGI